MARPKGVKEKKKRNRAYLSALRGGPRELGLKIPEAFTFTEHFIWNMYERKEGKKGGQELFNHPDQMMLAAIAYFRWCDSNPIQAADMRMFKGKPVNIGNPLRRPYQLASFCHWCGVTEAWVRQFRSRIPNHPEFEAVIEFVYEVCRTQHLEGGLVNQFNPNLVAMINQLQTIVPVQNTEHVEKQSIPEVKVYNTAPPLASDENEVEVTIVSSKPLKKKLNGKHK